MRGCTSPHSTPCARNGKMPSLNNHMDRIDPNHTIQKTPYIGGVPTPGVLVETVYRPATFETLFAVSENGQVRYTNAVRGQNNEGYIPYSAKNTLIQNKIILLPSSA